MARTFLPAQVGRDLGKRREPEGFAKWGAAPLEFVLVERVEEVLAAAIPALADRLTPAKV